MIQLKFFSTFPISIVKFPEKRIPMATISVIIPCYNVSLYIDRCLTSITSQSIGLDALEIICIDDASTDDTLQKLQIWEQRYPNHIILVPCKTNGRQGAARNIGLQYATSPWVSFVDSDDWIEQDYFEKLYQVSCQVDCDIVVCQAQRDSSTSLTYLEDRSTSMENRYMVIDSVEKRKLFLIFRSMNYLAWGKLIRKSLIFENQLFFPENLTYEDTLWGSLLHLYAQKVFLLEEKLYHYFINPQSTVLYTDSDHHIDLLTVQSMLWREWELRGFFEHYKEALEYDFLRSCYLGFIKVIVFRYQTPPYSLFLLIKEIIKNYIPDYQNNYYLQEIQQPELHNFIFQAISLPMNREEFWEFTKYVKSIGM